MTVLYVVLSVFPIIKVESVGLFAAKITLVIVLANLVGVGILDCGAAEGRSLRRRALRVSARHHRHRLLATS